MPILHMNLHKIDQKWFLSNGLVNIIFLLILFFEMNFLNTLLLSTVQTTMKQFLKLCTGIFF